MEMDAYASYTQKDFCEGFINDLATCETDFSVATARGRIESTSSDKNAHKRLPCSILSRNEKKRLPNHYRTAIQQGLPEITQCSLTR